MSATSIASESQASDESRTNSSSEREYRPVVDTEDAIIQTKPIHPTKLKEVVAEKWTNHQVISLLTKELAPKEDPTDIQEVDESCLSYQRKYEIT